MDNHISASQAAYTLQITLPTLNNWRKRGYIKAIKIGPGEGKGARYIYPKSEIDRIMQVKVR